MKTDANQGIYHQSSEQCGGGEEKTGHRKDQELEWFEAFQLEARKLWNNAPSNLREKYFQPRIQYLTKLLINVKIKSFKQKFSKNSCPEHKAFGEMASTKMREKSKKEAGRYSRK